MTNIHNELDDMRENRVYAFYKDHRAAYALVVPLGETKKYWRFRIVPRNDEHSLLFNTYDFPIERFKNLETFIGYCKLRYNELY